MYKFLKYTCSKILHSFHHTFIYVCSKNRKEMWKTVSNGKCKKEGNGDICGSLYIIDSYFNLTIYLNRNVLYCKWSVSKLYLNVPEPDSIRLLTALPCMALWFPLGNLYSVLTAQREWKSIIWHKERDLHLILNKFEGIGFLFMAHCLYLWGWFSYMQFYLFSSLGWKKHVKTILTERCTQSLKGFSCHILCPREGMKSAW